MTKISVIRAFALTSRVLIFCRHLEQSSTSRFFVVFKSSFEAVKFDEFNGHVVLLF